MSPVSSLGRMRRFRLRSLAWLLTAWTALAADDAAPKTIPVLKPARTDAVDFYREIVPLLQANCLPCHNRTTTKADLLLETPADLLKGGESGPAIVPGKSGDSLLLRLSTHEQKPRMPPKDNKVNAVNLTSEQLGLLALWIDQGAKESERRQEVIAWQPVSATFNSIYAVALSADGQFAACGRGNRLFLHHVPTGRLIGELADPTLATNGTTRAHLDLVNALAFNPADDTLASGGFAEVKLWRRGEAKVEAFAGPVAWPTNALKSVDGGRSLTVATNGLVRLKDGDGKVLAELRHGRARQRELTAAETALTVARQRLEAAKAALDSATKEVAAQLERGKKSREALAPAAKTVAEKELPARNARRELTQREGQLGQLERQPFKGTNFASLQKAAQEKLEASRKAADTAEAELAKARRGLSNAENERDLARLAAQQAQTAELMAAWRGRERELGVTLAETALAELRRSADTNAIHAVVAALSPDGRLVATVDAAGELNLFSGADGRPLQSTTTGLAGIDRVAFGDGVVFAGTGARTLRWDFLPAWTLVRRLENRPDLPPIVERVNALAFSADGRRLAAGSGEPTRGSAIHVWEADTGTLRYALRDPHSDTVQALAFSPDGRFLASGGADRFARVTETGSGRVIRSLEGHTGHVLSVAWKADGEVLASGGADFVAKLWSWARGERLKNVEGFGKEVTGLQFLGTVDQWLATSGAARVRVLNLKGEETGTLPAANTFVQAIAASAEGTLAAGGGDDGTLRVWNVVDRKLVVEFAAPTERVAER